MTRIHSDGIPAAGDEPCQLAARAALPPIHTASGALGHRLSAGTALNGQRPTLARAGYVSQQDAESALRRLTGGAAGGTGSVTLHDVMEKDPMMLSLMMVRLVLTTSGANAKALCKQLECATEVQNELLRKQVEQYQEQINKVAEQADQAHRAGILNALFDWIIGGVEAIVGVMKMAQGVLMADPLAIADGAAYFSAGLVGIIKASAETALLLGADKDTCNSVINVAGKVQNACEGVALTLDLMQIGRGISAARAITKASEEVLESGLGKEIIDAVAKGAEEELKVLAEKAGQEVSRVMGKDFGMALEREMVQVGDMAIEAVAHELEAETNMVRSMGKSFTREGVAELVKTAVEEAGKSLLNKGEQVVADKLREAILSKLRRSIAWTVVRDCNHKALLVTRATGTGAKHISAAIVADRSAELQREVEKLIVQQGFIDFMYNQTEEQKKIQQKRLEGVYQDSASAIRIASDIIDNCGTTLANIVGQRA